jgi:pimeloyl-ACP methyl ester carboxylesterase
MANRSVISADGTRVEFQVSGSGRPLVIVPGTLASPEMYQPLIELLDRRYQILVVRRRGYRRAEPVLRPCRIEHQVHDLLAVLEELDRPAVMFGHSFGGLVSLAVTIAAQDQVDRLVLYEPAAALLGSVLEPMLRRCSELADAGRPEEAVRTAFRVTGSPQFENGGLTDRMMSRLVPLVPGLIADLECATSATIPVTEWARTATPMLLLHGDMSGVEYARSMEIMRTIYPEAPCELLPGQAHFPHNMIPVAELISSWA